MPSPPPLLIRDWDCIGGFWEWSCEKEFGTFIAPFLLTVDVSGWWFHTLPQVGGRTPQMFIPQVAQEQRALNVGLAERVEALRRHVSEMSTAKAAELEKHKMVCAVVRCRRAVADFMWALADAYGMGHSMFTSSRVSLGRDGGG